MKRLSSVFAVLTVLALAHSSVLADQSVTEESQQKTVFQTNPALAAKHPLAARSAEKHAREELLAKIEKESEKNSSDENETARASLKRDTESSK